MRTTAAGRQTLLLFALASLAAVAAGAATLAATGLPPGSWLRNPAAWVVGALLAAILVASGGGGARLRAAFLLAGPVGLAATFLAAPVDGIHRWIDLGPLHVNMAALLLPAMIVAAGRAGIGTPLAAGAAAATALLLALQPDASQASAFAAAIVLLLPRAGGRASLRAGLAVLVVAAAAVAWWRPDPLQPVAEVEGILSSTLQVAPALALFAALALLAAAIVPLRADRGDGGGDAARALAAYFIVTALAPLVGAYPVPLVGLGMSFPVGWWLGVGLLCAGPAKEAANG